jgi:hypothetical protein
VHIVLETHLHHVTDDTEYKQDHTCKKGVYLHPNYSSTFVTPPHIISVVHTAILTGQLNMSKRNTAFQLVQRDYTGEG